MGLGNTLKIMLTNQVKCEKCGMVIVDGKYSSGPYDSKGKLKLNYSSAAAAYGDGVGVFNTLKYGSKKRILCRICEAAERNLQQMESIMAQEREELEEQEELQKENLRLENELLKRKINNEINIAPDINRIAKFCTNCGNALRQGARFCSKCGTRIG